MSGTSWAVLLLTCIGLLLTHAAMGSWTTGDPPPASIFAQRSAAGVVEARVASGRTNGSLRHIPLVRVQWDGQVTELRGLTGPFYDHRYSSAQAALRHTVAGQSISVKVIDGAPYADRTDWLRFGGAVWLSLCALFTLGAGPGLVFVGRAP